MSDHLKPCPFCGGKPIFAERHNSAGCDNNDCGCAGYWFSVSDWNRRASLWQPIETAPKDGTTMLLFMPATAIRGAEQVVGRWDGSFESIYDSVNGTLGYRGAWNAGRVGSFNYEEYKEENPTHWQPLPEPPKV